MTSENTKRDAQTLRDALADMLLPYAQSDNQSYDMADDAIKAIRENVPQLEWDQLDPVTHGSISDIGMRYTVWAMDGYGYCHFPNTPAGERFPTFEDAKTQANAHNVAQLTWWMGK